MRLTAGASTRPVLLQQTLSSPRTPAELASAAGAVAAVNGDFFDIDRTGTPDGPVVLDGRAVKASADPQWAVGLDGDAGGWRGRVGRVVLQGSAAVGGRSFPLAALCTRTVPADALVLFGPAWGAGDRSLTTAGGVELEVRGGAVTAVRAPGSVPVPADGGVLVASGTVAAALAGTPVGTPVTTDVRVLDDALPAGSGGSPSAPAWNSCATGLWRRSTGPTRRGPRCAPGPRWAGRRPGTCCCSPSRAGRPGRSG